MSPFAQHHAHIEHLLLVHARDWIALTNNVRDYVEKLPNQPGLFESLYDHIQNYLPLRGPQEIFMPWLLWEHIGTPLHLPSLQHYASPEFASMSPTGRTELLTSGIPLLTSAKLPLLRSLHLFDSLLLTQIKAMGLTEPERIQVLPQGPINPIELKRICPTLYPWLNKMTELHNWDTSTICLLVQNAYDKEEPLCTSLPTLEP